MKTCVITGAASGIGEALAMIYSREGYTVIGIDRNQKRALDVQKKLEHKIHFMIAELTSKAGLERILNELPKKIDVVIHSAGINAVGAFETLDIQKQLSVLDVNLKAPMLLSKGILERNLLPRGGHLIFISSLSHFVSYPGASVYAASKDGLTSYARSLRVALKIKDIQVMTVFPGPTRTPHAKLYSPDNSSEEKRMPPEVLAEKIYTAMQQNKHILIPGLNNKMFAFAGRFFPGLTEKIMKRVIFDKLGRG
jgi:short-subunit dehydrogenase